MIFQEFRLENIVITWRELLIGVVLILAVYIAEVLLLTRSGKGKTSRRDDEARNREMQSLELEISRLHERLEKLQADVEQLKVGQASAARPYGEAVKMAEGGVDVDQLAASCGISRGEAELIIAVNRFSQQKNSL
jgi:hypothetical protein